MSGRCGRCGAEPLPGAGFCTACGQAVGSAPTPAAGPGPEVAGGPVSPPSALSGRSTLLVIAGAVLVFVLALVVVVAGPGETKVPTSTTAAGPQPTQPESQPTQPEPASPNQPAPPGGSLRALVKPQVGPFQLQTLNDVASLGGANERLQALYRSADGVEVLLHLAAYPSPAGAEEDWRALKRELESQGAKLVEEGPVMSTDGTRLGTKSVYRGQREVVVWTNDNLSVLAAGPIGQAVAFYDASSI